VEPDWLYHLVAAAEKDKRIGAVCSKMLFFSDRQIIDSTGDFFLQNTLKVVTRGYKQIDRGQFNTTEECLVARAGAALYRREALEEVVLKGDFFDRHYFAYVEDTDLSIRLRLWNWKVIYEPEARVYHKVAATTKKMSYIFRRYHSGRNRLFTVIKNYPINLWRKSVIGIQSVDESYALNLFEAIQVYSKILASLLISLPRLLIQRKFILHHRKVDDTIVQEWQEKFSVSNK